MLCQYGPAVLVVCICVAHVFNYLSHGVDRALAQLVGEVVALHQADAVFARNGCPPSRRPS